MNYEWNIHWKDYYKILQVHPTAGQEVIKAAYERLAKIYHPDLNQGISASQMMKDINEAYQVLGTLETRRLYHPEWLKRRKQNNYETPPKTFTYDETSKQYESSIYPSNNSNRLRPAVKWIVILATIFIIVTIIVIINIVHDSSTDTPKTRLITGTYIARNLFGGEGELKIDNGLDLDAVAILSFVREPKNPLIAVYIRASDTFTITGIKDDAYILYFSIGESWDEKSKTFLEKVSYEQFGNQFDFVTTLEEYTTWEVTLNPVFGGEADTFSISENNFPSLQSD